MKCLARIVSAAVIALLVLGTPAIAEAAPAATKHASARKQAVPRTAGRTLVFPTAFNVAAPSARRVDKFRIVRRVIAAVKATSPTREDPRPVIRIATFFLDWKPGVDALIGACRRGVGVQVVLDGDIDNPQSRRLIRKLNADNVAERGDRPKTGPCRTALPQPPAPPTKPTLPKAPKAPRAPKQDTREAKRAYAEALERYRSDRRSYVRAKRAFPKEKREYRKSLRAWKRKMRARKLAAKRYPVHGADRSFVEKCTHSCRGGRGNMHSKFYSFSHSGPLEKLVMVSSSNLNRGGALAGWNDMVAMEGLPRIYRKFQQIHRQMVHEVHAGTRLVQVKEGPYTVRFFPLRKATWRNDPVLRDLGKIRCRSAFGRTRVHVSMFLWGGKRGANIARRLAQLGRGGCDVRVIYGAPTRKVRLQLRRYAVNGVIRLYDSRRDVNPYRPGYEVRTHGKFILVKGTFAGNRRARVVMTGTANWVYGSLATGDEVTVNIARRDIWADYLDGWRAVRRHSSVVPRYLAYR